MPRPKRHYFVPQWYLERFTDPKSGVLHAYDKTSETYWTPKPKNVMVIKDYHRCPLKPRAAIIAARRPLDAGLPHVLLALWRDRGSQGREAAERRARP